MQHLLLAPHDVRECLSCSKESGVQQSPYTKTQEMERYSKIFMGMKSINGGARLSMQSSPNSIVTKIRSLNLHSLVFQGSNSYCFPTCCTLTCNTHSQVSGLSSCIQEIHISCMYYREGKEPVYTLLRDPVEGDLPQYLVMEVQLPGIVSQSLHFTDSFEGGSCVFT